MGTLYRFLPFLAWFPVSRGTFRADLFAGLSVGLILVPQAMAYAQLAGLPVHFGLYAAFLPVIVGAMWGSSHQLSTGPVAMVALLTGATLSQFGAPGSEHFIALAILLALMVGIMELTMGLFKLGAIVSFLSHPVIIGFMNAAAIIIALSQLNKVLGVAGARSEHFMRDIWDVLQQIGSTHAPTLLMALGAMAVIIAARRFAPKLPGMLIAVALATAVSWAIGFENNTTAQLVQFEDLAARNVIVNVHGTGRRVQELQEEISDKTVALHNLEKSLVRGHPRLLALHYDIEVLHFEEKTVEREHRLRTRELRRFAFKLVPGADGGADRFFLEGLVPAGEKPDGRRWRFTRLDGERLVLAGGGQVVGAIPSGLPKISFPALSWDMIALLLPAAFVITLVGFMEALSIANAMATRTRQRVDPNQELIGQGLANIAGSFSHAFPVSGSFSRSAVNLSAGAVTGMSSAFAWLLVLATLLFLTPLLYHLPQAVLAAIIIMAVVNVVNFRAIWHVWKAQRHDGVAAVVTFVATLGFAPQLENGILIGAGLALVLYLYRTMRPRVAVLGRHPDGTLRDAMLHKLETSKYIIVIRFDGSLFFANVPYFEDAVLEQVARYPKAKFVLIVGDAINEIDGSGEAAVRRIFDRLKDSGVTLVFSGLKYQVLRVLENTGLSEAIGAQNFFRTEEQALAAIYARIDDPDFNAATCPLAARAPDSGRPDSDRRAAEL